MNLIHDNTQDFKIFGKDMKNGGKASQRQEILAGHFGVPPSVAHRALADTETLQNLMPHLLREAEMTLTQVLVSHFTSAAGMVYNCRGVPPLTVHDHLRACIFIQLHISSFANS